MSAERKLMFVCKRNSCRSQMAHGWASELAAGDKSIIVYSSGLQGSRVHPTAIKAMAEAGVDISSHTSNFLDEYDPKDFHAVVSMCGCGHSLPEDWQQCQIFQDWDLTDPDGQPYDVFQEVRGQVKERVENLLSMVRGDVPMPATATAWNAGQVLDREC
ncbi:unnamed protein product [Chrysoparadoxa australica]